MGNILNHEGPVWNGLTKLADLVILNLMTLIFCIPIVTIGASLTAAHYVALKIRRDEGHVIKNFWKSFKENLIQSTVIMFIFILFVGVCIAIYMHMMFNVGGTVSMLICTVIFVIALFILMTSMWVIPMQSKFINPIGTTIKNAFVMSFKYLLRTLGMLLFSVLPIILYALGKEWRILLLIFGFSVPIYICSCLYNRIFQEIEDMIYDREREKEEGLI